MQHVLDASPRRSEDAPYIEPGPAGRFLAIAEPWIRAGANVLPAEPGAKSPAVAGWGARPSTSTGAHLTRDWGIGEGALHCAGAPRMSLDHVRMLGAQFRAHNALVFPATVGREGCTVIDVDDIALLPQVLEACGPTEYRTISGRAGGGVHLWYAGVSRSGNGVAHGVDVKSSGGYVIAPGSIHETTQREYRPTPELAAALERGDVQPPDLRADWRERLQRIASAIERPSRLDLQSLSDTLKTHAKTKEVAKRLRAAADGKPIGEPGERDSALWHCMATLAEHWPRAQPDAILALFAQSLDVWQQDDEREGRIEEDWHGIALEKWERATSTVEDRAEADDERDLARRRTAWHWAGVDSDARATLGRDPIVVHTGRTYYMRIGDTWIGPRTREDFTPDVLAALRALYSVDAGDMGALLGAHGQMIMSVEYDYTLERSELRRGVLWMRTAPLAAHTPEYSARVDAGLERLAGHYKPQLEQWLAGLTRLDHPCRALVLSGPRGVGKSLLLAGIASLWLHGSVPLRNVVGRRFNDALTRSPLALADDDTAPAESGAALAQYLRQAVSDREQTFERKFHDTARLHGSLRIAIGTNDPAEFVQGAVSHKMNEASIAAFGERLLHIPCAEDAQGWWGTEEDADALAQGEIARHILYLAERKPRRQERFWVAAADESLTWQVQLSTGLRGDILLRLASGEHPGAERIGDTYVVRVWEFAAGWVIDKPRGWSIRTVGGALKALSVAVPAASDVPIPEGAKTVRLIHAGLVEWYARECGAA